MRREPIRRLKARKSRTAVRVIAMLTPEQREEVRVVMLTKAGNTFAYLRECLGLKVTMGDRAAFLSLMVDAEKMPSFRAWLDNRTAQGAGL